jgi:uncharacterized protein YjbI with pentapeptide repeats
MRRKQSAAYAGITPPHLPPAAELSAEDAPTLGDGATLSKAALHGVDWSGVQAEDVALEQVAGRRVLLSGTKLAQLQLVDSRLETCDLAAAEWPKSFLRRVELLGCRMVGAKLEHASLEDVVLKDCIVDYGLFWEASFKAARFERCSLREASFAGANLSGVVFAGCDLTRADLRNTKLAGADFRGSTLDGLQVGIKDLQGAIIDPTQAVHLASLLGMTVQPVDE